MDIVGHILVGSAVSGGTISPAIVFWSLIPDITAIPFQKNRNAMKEKKWVRWSYWTAHSPLAPALAYLWSPEAAMLVAAHLLVDYLTHYPPYSFLHVYSWDYKPSYYAILAALGALILCLQ